MSENLIGQKIGQYEIQLVLGKGGMSTVYRAYQPSMDRVVAIKVLPREFLHDDTFLTRFRQELRTIARLEHPHILPVYDSGEFEGIPYIVMRYLSGGTLSDVINSRLPEYHTITRLTGQIGEALDYAREHQVIHRDMKPSNILLDEKGNGYLSDFGIARVAQAPNLTGSRVIGTPPYIAPEMVRPGETVTGLADLYGLGVIVYEMLTGYVPYDDPDPMKVLMAHVLEPVPSLRRHSPDIHPKIDEVVQRCLAKHPEERYASGRAFANALEKAFQEARAAGPASIAETQPRQPAARPAPPPANETLPNVEPYLPEPPMPQPSAAPGPSAEPRDRGGAGLSCVVTLVVIGVIFAAVTVAAFVITDGSPGRVIGSLVELLNSAQAQPPGTDDSAVGEGDGPLVSQPPDPAPAFDGPDVLAFASNRDGDFEIYLIDDDGDNLTQITDNTDQDYDPAWSPDGEQIVFASRLEEGGPTELFIMAADGTSRRQLTQIGRTSVDPDWSPDGRWIVFATTQDGVFELFLIRPDGDGLCQLTSGAGAGINSLTPRWSPDGARIGFHARSGEQRDTSELYLLEVEPGQPCGGIVRGQAVQLTANQARDQWLDWSPDGRLLTYSSGEGQPGEAHALFIYDLVNNAYRSVVEAPGQNDDPVWSPDGGRIAFDSNRDGDRFFSLYILDVTSGQVQQITDEEADDVAPAWQPRR